MEQVRIFMERWRELDPRRKIVVWALLIGLVVGRFQIALPLEQWLLGARNMSFSQQASGDIVIVGIDDKSVETVGQYPWPRARQAEMAKRLLDLGAAKVYFDITFRAPSTDADDGALETVLRAAKGRVVLATNRSFGGGATEGADVVPLPRLAKFAEATDIALPTNFMNQADRVAPFRWVNGQPLPSLSFALAGKPEVRGSDYPISYLVNPASIPYVGAADLLAGKVEAARVVGKTVVIGVASSSLGDVMSTPGHGRIPGVFAHVYAAETLKRGKIIELGWLLPVISAALIGLYFATSGRPRRRVVTFVLGGALLLLAPLFLEYLNIFVNSGAGLVTLAVAGGWLSWRRVRQKDSRRTYSNLVSGLPNLNALRENEAIDGGLVVARVTNYTQIIASLPEGTEGSLVEQIVSRLAIGGAVEVYQGEGGLFVWAVPAKDLGGIGGQLDALHALFRNAVEIGARAVDLTLTFGVVAPDGRSIVNRLSSAIVASDEAHTEGLRWKAFDPQHLVDAEWKLSLLGQLDSAIGRGDVWVAYQPKLELESNRIVGAEALVRWSHPEKGVISPDEFISAAEQHGRIDRLTDFVLETAIRGAAGVNAIGVDFGIAVNISTRSLDGDRLVDRVKLYLNRYRFPASKLTLEVTESAAIGDAHVAFDTLDKLRELGVRVSIDDYGTGHSTLEYLKSLPANEVKIDRSFVSQLLSGDADRLLVSSTSTLR